jgi:hypothetical protein
MARRHRTVKPLIMPIGPAWSGTFQKESLAAFSGAKNAAAAG